LVYELLKSHRFPQVAILYPRNGSDALQIHHTYITAAEVSSRGETASRWKG